MSKLISIGTATPEFVINQMDIHSFMDLIYDGTIEEKRRLKLLYERSGINKRFSVIPDYDTQLKERTLYAQTKNLEPFPSIELRMAKYQQKAAPLAVKASHQAFQKSSFLPQQVTHLITVSCTGMSAPGLDLEVMELLNLPNYTERTSVNFMGCYAAVHALKQADAICNSRPNACVLIVCVELCTLHFQKTKDHDNLTANAIFGDGAAACIVVSDELDTHSQSASIQSFYSEVHATGKQDMAWQLSSTGFLMTLSSYIPQLIESNIDQLLQHALAKYGISQNEIAGWAIHPGGRKIVEVIASKLQLKQDDVKHSYQVLHDYGNMSSPTILFVLKQMLEDNTLKGNIFGAAFGPGLTMETFLVHK